LVFKKAFTLIEVMVAVVIVSVVIAALFKMRGDTTYLFSKLEMMQKSNHYATFLLWNRAYGLDRSDTNLYRLLDMAGDFDLDDDARKELKKIKVSLDYKRIETIDEDGITFEIGRSKMQAKDFQINLIRVIQP